MHSSVGQVRAVQSEQYEEAKRLKLAIEALTRVGAQISALEAKKVAAVQVRLLFHHFSIQDGTFSKAVGFSASPSS